ncbi:AAA family ATPase [Tepidibacter hydrothermalis]|uniref:AAA family ATPase n=1 Tax=Tepidibacter hydrothermalis TaxID=3036126 RepID=A0ABY8EIC1_9FIRM|nr:AAA family ATPase [Tepidibacter hydrothermalis]WFD11367.1 AAA family ATPase [Tepidibacter hydrothermalis]
MDIINIKFFNNHSVSKNNDIICFPYKKTEALFYYLVINKEASRDELVNLLWEDSKESTAKKNLRNAMYQIRKVFDMDIIISPKKSTVSINSQIHIKTDLNDFFNKENVYFENGKCEFLKGLILKNNENFNWWINNKRQEYKDMNIDKLYNKTKVLMKKRKYEEAIVCAKAFMNEDEFDERAYRALMNIYYDKGSFYKAINLYYRLEKMLDIELGIKPDDKTYKLYKKILNEKNISQIEFKKQSLFYYRDEEIKYILDNYNKFIKGKDSKSILITGEFGIGKTKLKNEIVNNVNKEDAYIIDVTCYEGERESFLKPWNDILINLTKIIKDQNINIPKSWKKNIDTIFPVFDINYENCEKVDLLKVELIKNTIISMITKVSLCKKIIVLVDDIHWMDKDSINLLESLLIRQDNINLIATARTSNEFNIDRFKNFMIKNDKLINIKLKRFDQRQVYEICRSRISKYKFNKKISDKIYRESEGNIFFVNEIIDNINNQNKDKISDKCIEMIKSVLIDLSYESVKILDIASVFSEGFNINILKLITGKSEIDLIGYLDELERKNIIKEDVESGKNKYAFTHNKLRKYILDKQSNTKKRIIYENIEYIFNKNSDNIKHDILFSKLKGFNFNIKPIKENNIVLKN